MGEFADGLEISRAAASELVARLTEKDVVRRETDPADRRVVYVRLAGAAEQFAGEVHDAWRRQLDAVFARFPGIDPDTLVAFLGALIDQLKGRDRHMTSTTPVRPAGARPAGTARNPWAVLAVLCLGLFMILLDGTIVNIAIPHIQSYYDTTYSNIEWVMNAYILAFAVLLVPMGRFGDLWGRRKLFLAGMALFTLGSLACGLAPSIYLLIAFRVIQGIGGAAMMPSTLSIIATVFRPRSAARPWASGAASPASPPAWAPSSAASSSSTSPGRPSPAAGAGSSSSTSPSASSACCSRCASCPRARTRRRSSRSTCPASVCSPSRSSASRSRSSRARSTAGRRPRSWACSPAPSSAFLLFFWREHRVRQPLIDFSLFRSLNFAAGNATGLLLSAAMMGAFFTIPIFLQSVLGFSAIKAGLVMAPMSVVIIFAAPVAGMLSDRLGSKWIVAAGMFLLAVGLAWMAGLIPGVEKISTRPRRRPASSCRSSSPASASGSPSPP